MQMSHDCHVVTILTNQIMIYVTPVTAEFPSAASCEFFTNVFIITAGLNNELILPYFRNHTYSSTNNSQLQSLWIILIFIWLW